MGSAGWPLANAPVAAARRKLHLNKIIKKLPEFIQNIIDRLFNQCNIDLKHFKQQYDPEVKRKEESRFKGFNLFNKKEIEKATKHINDKMDEYAEG